MRNEKNMGKGYCIKMGFKYAIENNYFACITMDADGQHPIELIPKFIEKINYADIVIGSRRNFMNLKNTPMGRYLSNRLNSTFISIVCSKLILDALSGYRAIRCEVFEKLTLKSNRFELEAEIIIKACIYKFKIDFVEIPVIYQGEKSHINKFLDTLRALKLYFTILLNL